jgi:cytochrome c-type biogenesis protein
MTVLPTESETAPQQIGSRRATRVVDRGPAIIAAATIIVVALGLLSLRAGSNDIVVSATTGGASLLLLAPAAFLAGMLSFLSPCCLPVLSAYAAYSAQVGRERLVVTTMAFFAGVATTMVVLGATATALSQILFRYLPALTTIGGLVIIGFGVMSLLGRGFSGMRVASRRGVGATGAYVYGATFALGWTACVGPILGALLTLLATQGLAVLQGALLAFIYALGLGMPLILLASFLSRRDRDSRLWKVMRGRGFALRVGSAELHLHTTSLASGLLLIAVGALLATGQLAVFSKWAVQMPLTQWVLDAEEALRRLLLGR